MNYITKSVIVSLIFSLFLLVTLQINKIINKRDDRVLGINNENTVLCGLLDSLKTRYCLDVISSPTTPVVNLGRTIPNNNLSVNPRNILVRDITNKNARMTWTTDKKVKASVFYGTNMASLLLMAEDTNTTTNHNILLTNLRSNTTYYYKIVVDSDNIFDNGGLMYRFKTN